MRALIGNKLENEKGQEQVLKIVNTVGQEHIIIEMWSARGNPDTPLYAWLVSKFGPDVNLANIPLDPVSILELIRRGLSYDPAHPYLRRLPAWQADQELVADAVARLQGRSERMSRQPARVKLNVRTPQYELLGAPALHPKQALTLALGSAMETEGALCPPPRRRRARMQV